MYGHKWVDMATPSDESKNGTSEPEVKKPSFSFGKTDEKKEEVSKPSFSFGSTSYGFIFKDSRVGGNLVISDGDFSEMVIIITW